MNPEQIRRHKSNLAWMRREMKRTSAGVKACVELRKRIKPILAKGGEGALFALTLIAWKEMSAHIRREKARKAKGKG